jgi:hypothetical protein
VDIFAFEMLLERFERFLRRENEKKLSKNCGCLIFDSKTKWENAYLRRICRALQSAGTSKLEIRNVIETVFFVPSEYSSGIQLADFCSYAVYFNFENLGVDKRPGRRFLQILPKFDKSYSKIVGLKIFP